MKRLLYPALLWACMAAYWLLGLLLANHAENWLAGEGIALGLALGGALLLPGPRALWTELLGTAATLPMLWRLIPFASLYDGGALPRLLAYGALYGILSLMLATLGPMLLLLTFGSLLE